MTYSESHVLPYQAKSCLHIFYVSFGGEVVGARDEAMPQPCDGEGRHREDAEGTHVVVRRLVVDGFGWLRELQVGRATAHADEEQ